MLAGKMGLRRYDSTVSAGLVGPVAVWAAIAFAVIAVISGRRWALLGASLSAAAATLVLGVALVSGDFSLAYVAETTSLATPWPYRLAALWGGMDGSMLFYTAMTLVLGAGASRAPVPVRSVAAVGVGLLSITILFANPFVMPDLPPVDGAGLLAILQHPAMIYHPPILYLGLTILVVPFALTVGMVLGGQDRTIWMSRVRRFLYVSWALLTFGMAAGANWAYVELGWGGFWAWDPVENTALMPWLATTVFLHTSRIETATGRMRRWNVLFASLPFALTVVGIYLTRSGATGSIHSFAEDPLVGRLLLVAPAVVATVIGVLAARSEPGEVWGRIRFDRNGWQAANAVLLTTALVFISAGSIYPVFSSLFLGSTVVVDPRYFVVTVMPIAVAVVVGVTISLRRSWVVYGVATMAAAVATWLMVGARVGVFLIAPALASLVLLLFDLVAKRLRGRMLTVYLAHIGVSLLLVGVAGSSFGAEFSGTMMPGDSVTVAGHEITLERVETGDSDRFVFVRANFEVDGVPVSPEIRAYEQQTVPVAEPVLRSSPLGDVIVAISLLFPDGETIEVSVFVRPLVWWVWAGALLLGVAGLVALFGRAGAASGRRRSAIAEPLRGETTSGSASR